MGGKTIAGSDSDEKNKAENRVTLETFVHIHMIGKKEPSKSKQMDAKSSLSRLKENQP